MTLKDTDSEYIPHCQCPVNMLIEMIGSLPQHCRHVRAMVISLEAVYSMMQLPNSFELCGSCVVGQESFDLCTLNYILRLLKY